MMDGGLTDFGRSRLSSVDVWAEKVYHQNALFAEQLHDMRPVLEAYDRYLVGGMASDKLTAIWSAYAKKWLNTDSEHVRDLMMAVLQHVADGIVDGCVERGIHSSEVTE